jgi:hypothetical protein
MNEGSSDRKHFCIFKGKKTSGACEIQVKRENHNISCRETKLFSIKDTKLSSLV